MSDILKKTINKRISRRTFLKASAAVGATTTASGLIMNSVLQSASAELGAAAPSTSSNLTWKPYVCLRCHSWCSHAVGIDADGVIRKVEGLGGQPVAGAKASATSSWTADPNFTQSPDGYLPYDPHNHGRICAKGNDAMEQTYNPDRVKYPLKRVGDRGSGKWKRITWAEAYSQIAAGIKEVIDIHPNNFCWWSGRDQTNITGGRFVEAVGSKNFLNHTSICESSRHGANRLVFGKEFHLPDLADHSASGDDVDYYLNFGGNPCEAGLPHAPFGRHWSIRRGKGCRFVTVDVRQSNSSAFSDESIYIKPGTDAALALAIMYVIMTKNGDASTITAITSGGSNTALGWEFLPDALAKYGSDKMADVFGMYRHQEVSQTGAIPGGYARVPDGDSLQSYVLGLGSDATVKTPEWAAPITGVGAGTIREIAKDLSKGRSEADSLTNYNHPIVDGYRGPAKHTDGTQQWRVIRSLNILTGNFDVAGGLVLNSGGHNEGGAPAKPAGRTYASTQTYYKWDTGAGTPAWPLGDWGVDQNMVYALRAACGVDLGAIPPAYALANGTIENTPKALMQFKNATTYSRPGCPNDKELFTAKNPDGSYKLKYNWSIDIMVGDGSRYADIILPDGTHPERYDFVGGHWFAFTGLVKLRQPVVGPLYEVRQVRAIAYELANTEPLASTVPNGGGPTVKDYFSYDPAVSTENWQTAGGNAAGNVRLDGTPDGEAATVAWMKKQTAGSPVPGGTTADKWDYITTNGVYCTGGAPTYTKTNYTKSGWKTGEKAEVYNAVLGTFKWRPAIASDPTFSSTPVYASDGNGGYDPAYYSETGWFGDTVNYTHQLTTYKLNVHDQANTNDSPRLMEIIGKNWAVMGVSGTDGSGPYALASNGTKIYDGDNVKLTSLTGAGVWEAKVTYRAQTGCVHVSHHMGHDGSSQGSYAVDGNPNRDDANNVAWGSLVTKGAVNTSLAPSSPRGSDDPMVLGKTGTNVNYVIVPNRSCPIGASLSFYDTRVKVEKVIL